MTKKEKFIEWLKRAPKSSHIIRVLAGLYLLYTAYQIFKELGTGQSDFLIIAFAVIFAIIGALILASSLYALNKYYYAENKAGDNWDKEESETEENNTDA